MTTEHPFLTKTDDSPFKDKRNQWLTRSLFFEMKTDNFEPMFTFKDDDYKTYKSLKKIYLSYDHIPEYEYEFATEILGGWEHWERLLASPDIRKHIDVWRQELDIKLRCEALRNIIQTARSPDKAASQAARYLANKEYIANKDNRGRPSKAEKEARIKEDTAIEKDLQDDLRRLGIVQGGKK